MVDDSTRKHREGLEHLKKAKEFAEWSRKDREKRLPPLTQEQASQMKQYLQMVEEHGISKISEGACEGCPVISAREGERLEVYRTSEAKTRGSFEHKHANES